MCKFVAGEKGGIVRYKFFEFKCMVGWIHVQGVQKVQGIIRGSCVNINNIIRAVIAREKLS